MVRKPTFKARTKSPLFIKLSEKNKKLIPNKAVKFLIWNIPAIITCPYATPHCKHFCYAVKAETAYPTVTPSRLKHFEESRRDDFVARMVYTIESYLMKPPYKAAKKIVVRIHESGDFYNRGYMAKWYKIAEHFKHDKRVVFMAYTKSVVYVDELSAAGMDKPNNMVIRFSIWDDTDPRQIAMAEKYNLPIYTAVDKFTADIKPQHRCNCADCAKCGKCWGNTKRLICEIH